MNKYVLRTSLVWLLIIAVAAFFYLRRPHPPMRPASTSIAASNELEPEAAGPPAGLNNESTTQRPTRTTEPALAPIQLSPERMQSIGVKLGTVAYKNLTDKVTATGTVEIDERRISYVQVRFPGFIRKVFANATYQFVRKGQPLLTVYSPELVATQQEYLLARQNESTVSGSRVEGVATGASALTSAAEQRLQQWQVSSSELDELKTTGKPLAELTVSSPVSGYITERNALPNMSVDATTRLYTIADLSRVWVEAQVPQENVGRLKPGDAAHIQVDAYPGKTFYGSLEQVLPQIDMATRTVRVRVAVANPGVNLKPGMYVNVDFQTALGRQLVVPASAVFQSGTRNLIFLSSGDGNLLPREVVLGPRAGDDVVVLRGVQARQQIVTSANFLIDSESQLQASSGASPALPYDAGIAETQSNPSPAANVAVHFSTNPDPPVKGANIFRVKLTGEAAKPIAEAEVTVTFFMPAMPAMGMSAMTTTVRLIEKTTGIYEGTGTLGSGGTFQTTVTVRKNGQTIATKRLSVNAAGGM